VDRGPDIIAFEPGAASRVGGHCYTDGKSPTLRAEPGDNGVTIAAGFKVGNSESAHSIGYAVETSPTLSAMDSGNKPAVAVYDMTHADEVMRKVPDGRAPTLNARMGTGGNQVPVVSYAMQRSDKFQESHVAHTLAARDYKSPTDLVSTYTAGSFAGYAETEQSGSLKASGGDIGGGSESIVCQKSVRRLTPTECERLQGLPDGYTLIDDKTCSDTARYKALGNGMAQPCADYVIRRIKGATA
jgi:DNA (cytosine-5)-methyltransferase 1